MGIVDIKYLEFINELMIIGIFVNVRVIIMMIVFFCINLIFRLSMKLVRMVFLYNVVYVCNVYVLLEYCLIKLKYNINWI